MPRWQSGRACPETAARIRTSREAKSKSREDAARACLVSVETVANWETARSEPTSSCLKTLCCLYDVKPDYLLGIAYDA